VAVLFLVMPGRMSRPRTIIFMLLTLAALIVTIYWLSPAPL